jgi:hypothetical protein
MTGIPSIYLSLSLPLTPCETELNALLRLSEIADAVIMQA